MTIDEMKEDIKATQAKINEELQQLFQKYSDVKFDIIVEDNFSKLTQKTNLNTIIEAKLTNG